MTRQGCARGGMRRLLPCRNAAMSKIPKQWIFCGEFHVTKEHVIPRWIGRALDGISTHRVAVSMDINLRDPTLSTSTPPRTLQGHIYTRKVRAVCLSCNQGWLSHLEQQVRPLLLPLIADQQVMLTVDELRTLACWVAKTAMVNQFFLPTYIVTPKEERLFLMSDGSPPDNWQVFAAPLYGKSGARTFRFLRSP